MESVGEFFRQVREAKGLTLDEVSSKTRIRSDFVRALEEGNFSKLPDQVFARGFVRSYARSLGLDEEDAIQRFTKSAGAFYDKQDERERLKIREVEEERKRQANRKAVSIAVAIAVLTLIFLLSREQSPVLRISDAEQTSTVKRHEEVENVKSESPPAVAQDKSDFPVEPVKQTEGSVSTSSQTSVQETRDPGPAPPPISAPKQESQTVAVSSQGSDGPLAGISLEGNRLVENGQLVLDLEATELSWVVVQIDNGSPQESLLRPGEKSQWKGQDQFILTLGNAGGVKAELNGKPQKPFGPSGKVARDIVLKR